MKTNKTWWGGCGVVLSAFGATACTFDVDDQNVADRARRELVATEVEAQTTIDPTYAVGVIPIGPGGSEGGLYGTTCPAGSQLITIYMDDEDSYNITAWSWSWRLPQDTNDDLGYPYHNNFNTRFRFCRVNGTSFRPMAREVSDIGHYYAVLRLGPKCPNGSTIMYRQVDNEDNDNENFGEGPYQPNESGSSSTMLHFCFFRVGSGTNVIDDLPNLGAPYAVFHDFDGPQPYPYSLALGKARHISDDEDGGTNLSSGGTSTERADFRRIISDTVDTVYDIARVW